MIGSDIIILLMEDLADIKTVYINQLIYYNYIFKPQKYKIDIQKIP